ncbi:GTD2A protein, partial [Amia calva]|nr:GTD2A protein [Amia calva]
MFTKQTTNSKAATIASFRVSHLIATHKKPFKAFLEAADALFDNFKNKSKIISAIQDMQLSVTRLIESISEDVSFQLKNGIENCVFFSLQFDESVDVVDTSQLGVFIRMVFNDCSVKEELLTIIPLKEKTREQDVYSAFKKYIAEHKIPICELASITTDGAPAMVLNYHCIIHQQALCGKVLNMNDVMDFVVKVVNSIRSRPLQRRLFKTLLDEIDAQYGDLLLHTDVRWLSRGKVLQRFRDLLPQIKIFIESRNEHHQQLNDKLWLLELAFLNDLMAKLNELNMELQGTQKDITEIISSVKTFQEKIKLWTRQLQKKDLKHFPSMSEEVEKQKRTEGNLPSFEKYTSHLEIILAEFERRFADFKQLEPVATFISFPFMTVDVGEIAEQIRSVFNLDKADIKNEIITIQNGIQLKYRASDATFWALVSTTKYPEIKKVALCIKSLFGSTYLCESAFSSMKIVKSKYRSTMTDAHLNDCMRLALTKYTPNFNKLADDRQCQASH